MASTGTRPGSWMVSFLRATRANSSSMAASRPCGVTVSLSKSMRLYYQFAPPVASIKRGRIALSRHGGATCFHRSPLPRVNAAIQTTWKVDLDAAIEAISFASGRFRCCATGAAINEKSVPAGFQPALFCNHLHCRAVRSASKFRALPEMKSATCVAV